MQSTPDATYRYRRTDQDRLGQWEPVGAPWKTAASSGLVTHDIYHHLPTDTGRFAQEVAALGAEWYVDHQPLQGDFAGVSPRALQSFERNVQDSTLNALDSKEPRPFDLPERQAAALSVAEMAFFDRMAEVANQVLVASPDNRARACDSFPERFVQNLLWGYAQAKARFLDQQAVRQSSRALAMDLEYLELSDVPYSHEVTISLCGTACQVEYSDADEAFVKQHQPTQAVLMPWCSMAPGYPVHEVSVHATAEAYVDYMRERLDANEGLEEAQQLIPQGESSQLSQVYVVDASKRAELERVGVLMLTPQQVMQTDVTPRGVLVL